MLLMEYPVCLSSSKDIGLKRYNILWNIFIKRPQYLNLYRDFLKEYEEMDHIMKEVYKRKEPEIS